MESSCRNYLSIEAEPAPAGDSYIITLTSIFIILLSLFIYLDARSIPNTEHKEKIVKVLHQSFIPNTVLKVVTPEAAIQPLPLPLNFREAKRSSSLTKIYNSFAAAEFGNLLLGENSLEITISSDRLFRGTGAELSRDGVAQIQAVVRSAKRNGLKLSVEYTLHAQPLVETSEQFDSLQESFSHSMSRQQVLHRLLLDSKLNQDNFEITSGIAISGTKSGALRITLSPEKEQTHVLP